MTKQTKMQAVKEGGMVAAGGASVGLPGLLLWLANDVWGLDMPTQVAMTLAGMVGLIGGHVLTRLKNQEPGS